VSSVTSLQSFKLSPFNNTSSLAESSPKKLPNILEKTSLPYITSGEQIQLAVIVDCMNEVLRLPEYH
jgi:hypothetical protein